MGWRRLHNLRDLSNIDWGFFPVGYEMTSSTVEKACAYANAGCTLAELGDTVGLLPSEYTNWLTAYHNEVELFSGGLTYADVLTTSDVLVGLTMAYISVPNTIYAAYCYDPDYKNGINLSSFQWNNNMNQFRTLGFHIEEFNNSDYNRTTGANAAKTAFISGIHDLASQKKLHGLYLIGHGTVSTFGYVGDDSIYDENDHLWKTMWEDDWGPQWTIDYIGEGFNSGNNGESSTWSIAGALPYHLGAALLYACHSDVPSTLLVNANPKAIHHGFSGTTFFGYDPVAMYWNDTGIQGTRKYYDS